MSDEFGFDDLLIGPDGDAENADSPAADIGVAGEGEAGLLLSAERGNEEAEQDADDGADGCSPIDTPPELEGPNADLALDAMRLQHESIMNALRNIT